MTVFEAIAARHSVKAFTDRPISRETIERLIATAVLAPNHRRTEPWRFYVLGPDSREAYGATLGARKAKKVDDPEAARAVVDKVSRSHRELPAMLAVAMTLHENPEIREEDYAATYMAVQNLCLAATALGLGTHIKSGGVMDDPAAREAVGVPDGQRIVAIVFLGEPAAAPSPKEPEDAARFTTWVP